MKQDMHVINRDGKFSVRNNAAAEYDIYLQC